MSLTIEISDLLNLKRVTTLLRDLCLKNKISKFFLKGELGAGKTTLVRLFVDGLPGGVDSEVSSPSFNLYNIYPTMPEVVHIDLYRCLDLEEEILEYLSKEDIIIFVEWCDKLPLIYWPNKYILLVFNILDSKRILKIKAKGQKYAVFIKELDKKLKEQDLL